MGGTPPGLGEHWQFGCGGGCEPHRRASASPREPSADPAGSYARVRGISTVPLNRGSKRVGRRRYDKGPGARPRGGRGDAQSWIALRVSGDAETHNDPGRRIGSEIRDPRGWGRLAMPRCRTGRGTVRWLELPGRGIDVGTCDDVVPLVPPIEISKRVPGDPALRGHLPIPFRRLPGGTGVDVALR